MTAFLHDIPPDILEEVMAAESEDPVESLFTQPFGLDRWPDVPTTVLADRQDRLFPFDFQVRVAGASGWTSSHCPAATWLTSANRPPWRNDCWPALAAGAHVHVSSCSDPHSAK